MGTRDSSSSYIHLHASHHADHLESFTNPSNSALPLEDIYIPPHLQPLNPEDEDDVVPDQHAAFGIQRATNKPKEVVWRDLGLGELGRRAPGEGSGHGVGGSRGAGAVAGGANGAGARHDEPVVLALRRRAGAAREGMHTNIGGVGGGAGNGLPR